MQLDLLISERESYFVRIFFRPPEEIPASIFNLKSGGGASDKVGPMDIGPPPAFAPPRPPGKK